MTATDRIRNLIATDEMYNIYNQTESNSCRVMASTNHPRASDYGKLRRYFDSLLYACNSGGRYITYHTNGDNTQYWVPQLCVTWEPTGELGKRFGRVYPALGLVWDEYLKACADAGWPEDCKPSLQMGTFIVVTSNYNLVSRLFSVYQGNIEIPAKRSDQWHLRFSPTNLLEFNKTLTSIDVTGRKGRIRYRLVVSLHKDDTVTDQQGNYLGEFDLTDDSKFIPGIDLLDMDLDVHSQVEKDARQLFEARNKQ